MTSDGQATSLVARGHTRTAATDLRGDFQASHPDEIWVADITYHTDLVELPVTGCRGGCVQSMGRGPVAGRQRPQHLFDAALERTLARRDPGLDKLVDREAAFLAELEDRQLLVGEVLRTSGNAEVSDGFQGGVQG